MPRRKLAAPNHVAFTITRHKLSKCQTCSKHTRVVMALSAVIKRTDADFQMVQVHQGAGRDGIDPDLGRGFGMGKVVTVNQQFWPMDRR